LTRMNRLVLLAVIIMLSMNVSRAAVYQGHAIFTQPDPRKPPKLICQFVWKDRSYTVERGDVFFIDIGNPVNDCLQCGPCTRSGLTCVTLFRKCPETSQRK